MNETLAQQSDIPVFSPRLDELMGAMIKGEAPNVGRFCGYCYTPLGKKRDECHSFILLESASGGRRSNLTCRIRRRPFADWAVSG